MASCSLGAANIKILPKLSFGTRVDNLRLNNSRICTSQQPLQYSATVRRSKKAFIVASGPTLETLAVTNSEETKMAGLPSQLIPESSRLKSLLEDICDTTTIAEVELKLGEFRLYVRRHLAEQNEPPPAIPSPSVSLSSNNTVVAPETNGSVSTLSLAITKLPSSSGGIQSLLDKSAEEELLDKAADDGLVIVQSPKVGFFRRSRTIKGKRAPPSCKEKQIVKEGQVLCFVEQLGCEIPVESDVSGEVVKILREDGEPVGYNDPLVALLPSFPGIKKLQ